MLPLPDAAHNLLLLGELRRIVECFERAGLRYYVIKGVPLTLSVFGNLLGRDFVDNDVVVHEADCDAAYRLLVELGFHDYAQSYELSRQSQFQHALVRAHPTGALPRVELHFSPFSPLLFRDADCFWTELVRFEQNGLSCWTLSAEACLVHLVTHWLSHGLNKGSILRDVGVAWDHWSSHVNTSHLFHLAQRVGVTTALGAALHAATQAGLCRTPWPLQWLNARARRVVNALGPRSLSDATDVYYARSALSLALLDDASAALRVLRWELMPSEQRLRYIYGADTAPWRLKAAYALRPLKALLRGLKPPRR